MRCRICGKASDNQSECKSCDYFLRHGSDEETIKRMYSDDKARKIWKENEEIAVDLADAYYDSLLDGYNASEIKKFSKLILGYNTFTDGIRLGLDVSMPLLDRETQEEVKAKIISLIIARKDAERRVAHRSMQRKRGS
jgi:hypothetical protein